MEKERIILLISERIEKLRQEERKTPDPRIAYALDLAVKELDELKGLVEKLGE